MEGGSARIFPPPKKKRRSNSEQGTVYTTAFNVLNICLVIFISTKLGQRCISLSCLPRTHVQHIPVSIHERHGNSFLAVSWMASHCWAAQWKPTAPWGTVRLLTAGGHQASHMDVILVWWTGSTGVSLPTHSRMVLAGHKSVCSVLPVWAGFSQNEYLWCFHISDKPLESHYVVWIQMRLMAAAQCPTTKTNPCKSDPVYRGLKLNQCRGLNDPVGSARPECWWAPSGNMGWGPQLQVGDLKVSCHLWVPWT